MNPGSHIKAAVGELQAERDHLAARLTKVDAAIAAVNAAFHLPTMPVARTPRIKKDPVGIAKDPAPTNGHGTRTMLTDAMIVNALKAGPMKPGALGKALGADRVKLRFRVKGLEQRGFVTQTGTTMSRLIQLTAKAAKEAP
jgi:hypothetical protein